MNMIILHLIKTSPFPSCNKANVSYYYEMLQNLGLIICIAESSIILILLLYNLDSMEPQPFWEAMSCVISVAYNFPLFLPYTLTQPLRYI